MTDFAHTLKTWYLDNARDLPWRTTDNPYKIWLSEIILQQTQVKTGLPYFERIVAKYPDVEHLADVNPDEFMRDWQGLGYYRRAQNLLKAARQIVDDHHGVFPESFAEIQKLAGVGEYTAAAIASFAFNEAVPVIDGNVKRVISRIFGIEEDLTKARGIKSLRIALDSVFDAKDPAIFNQAIMEFGALQCTKSPDCKICPFKDGCLAFEDQSVSEIPYRKPAAVKRERYFHYFIHVHKDKLAMKQRSDDDIWSGLFEMPMIELMEVCEDPVNLLSFMAETGMPIPKNLYFIRRMKPHVLSHQNIQAMVFLLEYGGELTEAGYYSLKELEKLPKPKLISNIFDFSDVRQIIFPGL